MFWKRFRRDKSAFMGLIVLFIVAVTAIIGPYVAPYNPAAQSLDIRRQLPSRAHPLGADAFGRDILTRILYGSRLTVTAGVLSVLIAGILGSLIGLITGYYEGLIDNIGMRLMDFILAFPYFLLSILVVAMLGPSLINAVIAVAVTTVPNYARVVRSATMVVKRSQFIEAAKAMGANDYRIIWEHILPNVLPPLIVVSTVGVASGIISVAALSFLGLGAQPPQAEWGLMLSEGRAYITAAPHITVFPGLCIALLVLALNLVGDGLRDSLDPRLK